MRKILIGLISFAAVIGLFLLYSKIGKTPPIDTEAGMELISDSNIGDFGDANEIGKIDEFGVGTQEKAYYVNYNENNEIISESGFEKLLYRQGDMWDVRKPYRNIFKPDFKCYMTADKGSIEIETAAGSTTPKDATFSGNVIIRILPAKPGGMKEKTIYLDDVVFLSDRSELATSGPVRVESEDFKMTGTGMRLVYNELLGRFEFFRIFDLESLVLKVPKSDLNEQKRTDQPAENITEDINPPDETVAVKDGSDGQQTEPEPEEKQEKFYKCLFSKNVFIDTPDELLYAAKDFLIKDFFLSNDSQQQGGLMKTAGSDTNEPVVATVDSNVSDESVLPASDSNEPNEPAEQLVEVTITCDNGLTIVPAEVTIKPEDLAQTTADTGPDILISDVRQRGIGKTTLITREIEYNMLAEDTLAVGPTELTFYTEDANDTDPNRQPIPAVVTSQKQARFSKSENQIVFEGDCYCKMGSEETGKGRSFELRSPVLTVNLPEGATGPPFTVTDIVATGPARLDFFVDDISGNTEPNELLPAKVTAKKQARFVSSSNQVIFEGSCQSIITRKDPNYIEEFTLLSELMTVDLPEDTNDSSSSLNSVKHLRAEGGVVTLAAVKKAPVGKIGLRNTEPQQELGGIKILCRRIDYDSLQEMFLATGPAKVTISNTKVPEPNDAINGAGPGERWWAIVENCGILKYLPNENRIIADAEPGKTLSVQYISVEDGQYGPVVLASAGHADIVLKDTPEGKTELSTLVASKGIEYKTEKGDLFLGSELFYNQQESLITVIGDQTQPCYYNGALVDEIKYNLKTGSIKAKGVGAGALDINKK